MEGTSIPHMVQGQFGASTVVLIPAGPGTGVIAGSSVRAVCEACGIRDILTKSLGSSNPINLVKAAIDGLKQLRTKHDVERLRGVSLT
jgi:small subunit ribosomal protein S5